MVKFNAGRQVSSAETTRIAEAESKVRFIQ
jgi:hypothetical protein